MDHLVWSHKDHYNVEAYKEECMKKAFGRKAIGGVMPAEAVGICLQRGARGPTEQSLEERFRHMGSNI